jgi:hypothetical protein
MSNPRRCLDPIRHGMAWRAANEAFFQENSASAYRCFHEALLSRGRRRAKEYYGENSYGQAGNLGRLGGHKSE